MCSLELAKRLKELGVKQESQFYWWEKLVNNEYVFIVRYGNLEGDDYTRSVISAFTVAELYEIYRGLTKEYFILQGTGNQADYLAEEIINLLKQ